MQNETGIGPLTKVSLIVTPSFDGSGDRPTEANIGFEFIYGIGTDGLCTFEKVLNGLSAGARIKIRVEANEMQSYFEHLQCPLLEALKTRPPFNLAIEILSVTPATDRELVHALANKDGSGCYG